MSENVADLQCLLLYCIIWVHPDATYSANLVGHIPGDVQDKDLCCYDGCVKGRRPGAVLLVMGGRQTLRAISLPLFKRQIRRAV